MKKERTKTTGKMLKMFGIMILITQYEFTSHASLWSTTATYKYMSAPSLGKTGMPRKNFDNFMRHLVWSEKPEVRPNDTSHGKYRWLLVDGFLNKINEYRAKYFNPSDITCVDESISIWYEKGGHWINHGLPMYVAIDRKSENGC